LDEIRVYAGLRSGDWINQAYQAIANQGSQFFFFPFALLGKGFLHFIKLYPAQYSPVVLCL
jgi:hypothetical protein